MEEELERISLDVSHIKNVLLSNKNIDILLYLAKYNPDVSIDDIVKAFGKDSLKGLKELEKCNLLKEQNGQVTLTHEGIFQVEGLVSIIA